MKNVKTLITAAAIAALLTTSPLEAVALSPARIDTSPQDSVSLPYVDDVNPAGRDYVATVTACGRGKIALKVTQGKKRVKVRRVSARVWLVGMKRGHHYKIAAKPAAGGEWRAIGYTIY